MQLNKIVCIDADIYVKSKYVAKSTCNTLTREYRTSSNVSSPSAQIECESVCFKGKPKEITVSSILQSLHEMNQYSAESKTITQKARILYDIPGKLNLPGEYKHRILSDQPESEENPDEEIKIN